MENHAREDAIYEKFVKLGAIVTDGHFVNTGGSHTAAYVNKDRLYVNPKVVADLCGDIAIAFAGLRIEYDIVVGVEKGGIILAQWTAYNSIGLMLESGKEILAAYAERKERSFLKAGQTILRLLGFIVNLLDPGQRGKPFETELAPGEEFLLRSPDFVFKRGYDKDIAGRRVLIVEDNLNTGRTVQALIRAIRSLPETEIVGIGALCNRSGLTSEDFDGLPLVALLNLDLVNYPEEACPMCHAGIPVNTDLGKGAEWLARKSGLKIDQ